VAEGGSTTLNKLFAALRQALRAHGVLANVQPQYRDFRGGDVWHSHADVCKAEHALGYAPTHCLADGVVASVPWYAGFLRQKNIEHST
jgi:UDP-N-acetylglucosamine 4-epimerase